MKYAEEIKHLLKILNNRKYELRDENSNLITIFYSKVKINEILDLSDFKKIIPLNLSEDFMNELYTYYSILSEIAYFNSEIARMCLNFDKNSLICAIHEEIKNVINNIEKNIPERAIIINKVYNYKENIIEYQLDNGDYVGIHNEKLIKPYIEKDMSVFPLQYLNATNAKYELRKNKLINILK